MKINDKIVCINIDDISKLKLNSIYTVENYLGEDDDVLPQVKLEEIDGAYYKAERFISLRELRKQKLLNIKNTIKFNKK